MSSKYMLKNFISGIIPSKNRNPEYWTCKYKLDISELKSLLETQKYKQKYNMIVKASYKLYYRDFDLICKEYLEKLYMQILNKINKKNKILLYPVHKNNFERFYVLSYKKNDKTYGHYDACPANIIKCSIIVENKENKPKFWVENNNVKNYFRENEGDIVCFRSNQTRHGVEKIKNKRIVLIFSYSDIPNSLEKSCICSYIYN